MFLADLLHVLTILSKILQYKFVDVTDIRLLVKAEIESICMLYLVGNLDLNEDTFHENFGHLQRLSYEISCAKFYEIDKIMNKLCVDLVGTLFS